MPKFVEVGRKVPDYSGEKPISESTEKPKKFKREYDSITLNADEFAYLSSLKIGGECELKVKVKKTSESEASSYDNEKSNKIRIEILKIAEPEDEYNELTRDK